MLNADMLMGTKTLQKHFVDEYSGGYKHRDCWQDMEGRFL